MADESDPINWGKFKVSYIQPPNDLSIVSGVPSAMTCSRDAKIDMNRNFYFFDLDASLIGQRIERMNGEFPIWIYNNGLFKKYNRLAYLFNWAGPDLDKILVKKCTGSFKGPTSGTVTVQPSQQFYFGSFNKEWNMSWVDLESFRSMFTHLDFYPGSSYTHPSFTRLLWDAVFASALDESTDDNLFAPYRLYLFYALNGDDTIDNPLDWTLPLEERHPYILKKKIIKDLSQLTREVFLKYCKDRWHLEYTDEESFCAWFERLFYFNDWYTLYLILWDMMDGIHYICTDMSKQERPEGYKINRASRAVNIYYADDEELIQELKTSVLTGMQEGEWEKSDVLIGWNVYKELKGFPIADQRFYEAQIAANYAISGAELDEQTEYGGWDADEIELPRGVESAYEKYHDEHVGEPSIEEALDPLMACTVQYEHEILAWNDEVDLPKNPSMSAFLSSMIKSNFNEDMWQEVPWWKGEYIKNVDLLKFAGDVTDPDVPCLASPLYDFREDPDEDIQNRFPSTKKIHDKSIGSYTYYPESSGESNYEYFSWNEGTVALNLDNLLQFDSDWFPEDVYW